MTRPCPGADHRPPDTGGSCACGAVTRIPAPQDPGPLLGNWAQALADAWKRGYAQGRADEANGLPLAPQPPGGAL